MSPPPINTGADGLVIEATGLAKQYRETIAVGGIDLAILKGEIFGLLGPNGAGKTTTILMLLGLTDPTGGSVRVVGVDPSRQPLEVKRQVGYLPDSVGFYDNLTARENLRYTARLARIARGEVEDRVDAALNRVGLRDVADRRVAGFSRGMRQRLGLAEIRMKHAAIAILDEPTSGLDPQATDELLGMIREFKADGVTVLLSSHLLDQVQRVCDRVALFNHGQITLQGSVPELARKVLGGEHGYLIQATAPDLRGLLQATPGVNRIADEGANTYRIFTDQDVRTEVARRIVAAGGQIQRVSEAELSLDDIYRRHYEAVRRAA